eukprot:8982735-Heterocapsa_arctica.AAC.1
MYRSHFGPNHSWSEKECPPHRAHVELEDRLRVCQRSDRRHGVHGGGGSKDDKAKKAEGQGHDEGQSGGEDREDGPHHGEQGDGRGVHMFLNGRRLQVQSDRSMQEQVEVPHVQGLYGHARDGDLLQAGAIRGHEEVHRGDAGQRGVEAGRCEEKAIH